MWNNKVKSNNNNKYNDNDKNRSSNNNNNDNDLKETMTDWKRKKLWLEEDIGQAYGSYKHYMENNLKQLPEETKQWDT